MTFFFPKAEVLSAASRIPAGASCVFSQLGVRRANEHLPRGPWLVDSAQTPPWLCREILVTRLGVISRALSLVLLTVRFLGLRGSRFGKMGGEKNMKK